MVYYGVLKNLIEQPKTDKELIQSILQKAASIVTEYGIDYVMEHNKDHYFDEDNNEVIELEMKPIIDYNATEVYKPGWGECILYNYTKNKYTMLVENEEHTGWDDDNRYINISKLPNARLVKINKGLISCAENVRRDKKLLSDFNDLTSDKRFICGKDGYWGDLMAYYIIGDAYISGLNEISVRVVELQTNKSSKSVKRYGQRTLIFHKIKDVDACTKDKIVERMFNCMKDDKLTDKYYKDQIKQLKDAIKKTEDNNKALQDRINAGGMSKTETLKAQLAISENEDDIVRAKKDLEKANSELTNINGSIVAFRKKIEDQIDNMHLDKYAIEHANDVIDD